MKKSYVASIRVGTRLQDNGDGGYTLYMYRDYDAAVAAKREQVKDWFNGDEERLAEFESDHDEHEYECGYLGEDTIEIEVREDGAVRLAKECSFHAGQ